MFQLHVYVVYIFRIDPLVLTLLFPFEGCFPYINNSFVCWWALPIYVCTLRLFMFLFLFTFLLPFCKLSLCKGLLKLFFSFSARLLGKRVAWLSSGFLLLLLAWWEEDHVIMWWYALFNFYSARCLCLFRKRSLFWDPWQRGVNSINVLRVNATQQIIRDIEIVFSQCKKPRGCNMVLWKLFLS